MDEDALSFRIAAEIADLIAVGDIKPASHLSTPMLANRFEVSRTPVREALVQLAKRGVVQQRANRGYFACTARSKGKRRKPIDLVHPNDAPAVYYKLAEDWLRDAVPAEVNEQFLLERYGLTKGQLATILNRATNEGWMERKAGYGWRLLPVAKTPEAHEQICRFRIVIEPAAMLEPTFQLDRPASERMRLTFQTMLDSGIDSWPADRLHRTSVDFHEDLARMSRNPLFLQSVVRANRFRQLLEYRTMIDRRRVRQETCEHIEINNLLLSGDIVGASYAMRQHLARALARKRAAQLQFNSR